MQQQYSESQVLKALRKIESCRLIVDFIRETSFFPDFSLRETLPRRSCYSNPMPLILFKFLFKEVNGFLIQLIFQLYFVEKNVYFRL